LEQAVMVSLGRHQKKEIAEAIRRAEAAGLRLERTGRNHTWGRLSCEKCKAERAIPSTPTNAGRMAVKIDRFTQKHLHR
jgi:hypothetical protein